MIKFVSWFKIYQLLFAWQHSILQHLTIKNWNLFPSNINVLQSGDGVREKIDDGRLKTGPLLCRVTRMIKFDSWFKSKLLFDC
jgi:hypothetical protein